MDDVARYDARADTIRVDDIATDTNNQIVLRRFKRKDAIEMLRIDYEHNHDDEEDCVYYFPEGDYDMRWLGYFVGKNDCLKQLVIKPFIPISSGWTSVRELLSLFSEGSAATNQFGK